jgi:RHH-type transcriptional regulator, proline utilization regulon repressor / proline dehydrogenase / delta 1-pyrroline-5-carboxylate dehydrogenase
LNSLLAAIAVETAPVTAAPLIDGKVITGTPGAGVSPIDGVTVVGQVTDATAGHAEAAIAVAIQGFQAWSLTQAETRAVNPGARGIAAGAKASAFHRAAAARRRQDAG